MRFSEKSFEVRFCATFSAALMPFNRNPQWFGMTQAQERMTGIDTMLSIGGKLLIFQFKAKQDDKFKLEQAQWQKCHVPQKVTFDCPRNQFLSVFVCQISCHQLSQKLTKISRSDRKADNFLHPQKKEGMAQRHIPSSHTRAISGSRNVLTFCYFVGCV